MDAAERIGVKRAFVLADWLKDAPFDSAEIFRAILEAERLRVERLSEADLDSIISRDSKKLTESERLKDSRRLTDYNKANWKREMIELRVCSVYPRMGERPWAQGFVPDVAEKFKRLEPLASRIWAMKRLDEIFAFELPIVVLRSSPCLHIDDGSHRAVAMALCNIESVSAWIGTL
jgi:hypothetical protein